MKSKEVMFPSTLSTAHFQRASQSSNLRGAAGMHSIWMSIDEEHSASTLNLWKPCFPSPQPFLHQRTRCTFRSYSENTASPTISTMCTCVQFTSQHSTRIGTEYRVLQHLHEGLWGPLWGWIHNSTPKWNSATLGDLLEVSVQLSQRPCCCTWEQQLFPFGSKKSWKSLWDRKTASPDCIFTL